MANTPSFVLVLGVKRSGTSYLTRCLSEAGIGMWNQPPTTDHLECPEMIRAMDEPDSHKRLELLQQWKRHAQELGGIRGCKEPRLIMHPAEVAKVFRPDETLYIICHRPPEKSARSLSKLASHSAEYSHDCIVAATLMTVFWSENMGSSLFEFDYEGDIFTQERALSTILDRPVPMLAHWHPKEQLQPA